jgi:hypothetical protein
MHKHIILGIHLTDRMKQATEFQALLSKYGCSIKTRIGLHEVGEGFCAPGGLVLLEMFGDEKTIKELADHLARIEGVEVKKMVFTH